MDFISRIASRIASDIPHDVKETAKEYIKESKNQTGDSRAEWIFDNKEAVLKLIKAFQKNEDLQAKLAEIGHTRSTWPEDLEKKLKAGMDNKEAMVKAWHGKQEGVLYEVCKLMV